MGLDGQSIIITGASSGIGAAAARLFAKAGAKLVLGARRADRIRQLADEIVKQGGTAVWLDGDVGDEGYAAGLVDLAVTSHGGLDGAFNNAGTTGDLSPVHEMETRNWDTVIATNLTSAYYAAKYQIPAIERRGGGAVVFTSSFVGPASAGLPGMAAYAASKAGLVGLVRSLAVDHGPGGIRINALLPGGTITAMAGDDPDVHEYIAGLHPLQRMATPDEIAETAMFLLSDQSSFITGSALFADGGVSVRL